MQAKNKLYHPATIGADRQSVPGTVIPDRHDGIAMLKELLEYLGGPGDSQISTSTCCTCRRCGRTPSRPT